MKQLQKHLIIILVMGIMLAAALIGGISTFTFREISSNDNRAIMKSIQQTDMEELNDTLRVTAQTVNALTASYADIVPDDLSLLKDPDSSPLTKTRRKILATIFSLRISRLLPSTTA